MANDLDEYLSSPDALCQTREAVGNLLNPRDDICGFRVVSFLGRGATSEVWRVYDAALNRDLALKMLAKTDNAVIRERFLSEARILAQLDNPNVVRIHSFGETNGHLWFTMDLLRPLPEHPPPRMVCRILGDILDGVEFLHENGIIHRDIKPSNVLLDTSGHAVLADLGIAHLANVEMSRKVQSATAHNLTLANGHMAALGTPGFGAPEQFAGGDVSPATDIHAIGSFLMTLFDNRPPFLWHGLIRRMTSSLPCLRPKSVKEVRTRLRTMGFLCTMGYVVVVALAGLAAWGTFAASRPKWRELPSDCIRRFADRPEVAITLPDDGHYFLQALKLSPVLSAEAERIGPELREMPDGTVDIGYPIEILKKDSSWQRRQVKISGQGTLKCPVITYAEVHINSGITFITSGKYEPDNDLIHTVLPPPSATFTNEIGYAAYIVEPDAKLVFTDNTNYPQSLIDHVAK